MKIKTYEETTIDVDLTASFNPQSLIALPALIDPHVHFRVPGGEHKEDWKTGAAAAIHGGVATVFDMPNNTPAVTTAEALHYKKRLIEEQLKNVGIPLRYHLYFGATPDNIDEIKKVKDEIVAIKLFMGSSTGNLLVDKKADQEEIFKLAAELGLIVAVHAEDETEIRINKEKFFAQGEPASGRKDSDSIKTHGLIRDRFVATTAVAQALELAEFYKTRTYILHMSTKEEVALIRSAKEKGAKVYAETTPHHLFLDSEAYAVLGSKAQMNPPLRTPEDQRALWAGIADGTIDCIGTDHAPHTLEEKAIPYPNSPSGVPGIETSLPLLLNAYNKGKISLEKMVAVTSKNAQKIFALPANNDWVIVDLSLEKEVKNENLQTKCGWSPFAGWRLKGWPVATILNGKVHLFS